MSMSISICILTISLLASLQVQVFAQVLSYGAPISYTNEDDDLGLLLAILLLSRNRGGCNCCNCCNAPQNIPIPYPIPFPTNNPIINTGCQTEDDDENKPKVKVSKEKDGATKIRVDVTDLNKN